MGKKRIIKKAAEGAERSTGSAATSGDTGAAGKRLTRGVVHILATYNNTLLTVADERGNVVARSSAGAVGYSGTRKATPFVAARAADSLAEKMRRLGLQEIAIRVKGVGSGRDAAIRALANQGFAISVVKDVTPVPHNGPRPRKVRRV